MNVQKVWDMNITGKGIVVTILDDGLEKDHPDIANNYVSTRWVAFVLLSSKCFEVEIWSENLENLDELCRQFKF